MNLLEQTRANIEIRPFKEQDYDAVVTIWNAAVPHEPWTVEEFRYEDQHLDRTKYILERDVALDRNTRTPVAYGHVRHLPWNFHPRKFGMTICVLPDWWGHGIGSCLWQRLLQRLEAHAALDVRTRVRADYGRAMRFVRARGFTELMRSWESHLDVAACDLTQFQRDVERAKGAGATIVTLGAEAATDPSSLQRAHALEMELGADVPTPDPFTPLDLAEWRAHTVDAPWFLPDAYFLAVVADQYIGVSTVWKSQTGNWLHQGLTGVQLGYRGRGIATALKVKTVEYALRHGYQQIRTHNEIHNAAMIAINDRFGFQKQPAWITLGKDLGG